MPIAPLLTRDEMTHLLHALEGWSLSEDGLGIQKNFSFKNYYQTMAFVNAVAWIAHQTDHHPDLTVSYNKCRVTYSTHSAGGITEKDIASARLTDAL